MTTSRTQKLEIEVAVINNKLDDIKKGLDKLSEWTIRHEADHKMLNSEHEQLRTDANDRYNQINKRMAIYEKEFATFSSKQTIINAILSFIAGTATTIILGYVFGVIGLK